MWEPSQATLDKDINGLVLLASAGCRLFGERKHRETVYVLCGGKGTAPGCALHGNPKVPGGKSTVWQLHEIAALAAIQQQALLVFVGDHRQTPGGLSKGRAAAANGQKLLHHPLGLQALNRLTICLLPGSPS